MVRNCGLTMHDLCHKCCLSQAVASITVCVDDDDGGGAAAAADNGCTDDDGDGN